MSRRLFNIVHKAKPENGASLVEYALLLSLIALVCIAAVGFLGTETQAPYSELASGLRN